MRGSSRNTRDNADSLRVTLLWSSTPKGAVTSIRVLKPSGNKDFDSIVLQCVRDEWVFSPAIRKGRKVRCMVQQLIWYKWTEGSEVHDIAYETLQVFHGCSPAGGPSGGGVASEPKLDPKRIINDSNSFLKEREPEMTEEEYALYQKVVTMLSTNPDFALKLLEAMMSDKEQPSPAFHFILGNAYYAAGMNDKSEANYRSAVESYPTFLGPGLTLESFTIPPVVTPRRSLASPRRSCSATGTPRPSVCWATACRSRAI